MRSCLFPASFILSAIVMAQPGSLDTSFGTNGLVILQPGTFHDNGLDILCAPDTTSYTVSLATYQDTAVSAVTHLLVNGQLDTSFGDGGFSYIRGGQEFIGRAIARASDGSLFVTGDAHVTGEPRRVLLAKLLVDGTPDESFGFNGKVILSLGSGNDLGADLTIDANGRIIIVGTSQDVNGFYNSFILRFNPDGALDNTFSDDGKLFLTAFTFADGLNAVTVAGDGTIYGAGDVLDADGIHTLLVKADPTGQWVTGFGSGGYQVVSFSATEDHANSIAWNGSRLYMCGDAVSDGANRNGFLARFTEDGDLDSAFNATGSLVIDVSESDVLRDLVLDLDGRVLACGSTGEVDVIDSLDVLVVRALPDGMLDVDLDYDGVVITSVDTHGSGAYGIARQADDKILVTGFTWPSDIDLLVARYFGGSCDLSAAIMPPGVVLCPGTSDTLEVDPSGQYQWYANGEPITGETGPTLFVDGDDAGTWFTVEVTDAGCAAISDSVLVDGYAFLPPVVINAGDAPNLIGDNGQQIYCQGDDPILMLNAPYDTNIQWSAFGEPIAGANDTSLAVSTSGSYSVQGAPSVCPDFIQDAGVSIVMDFHPYVQPTVYASGILLCPDPEGISAQWYYNGMLVAGIDQCVIPIDAGNYTVFVDYGDSCSVMSAPYTVVGVEERSEALVRVSPSPTSGLVRIAWPSTVTTRQWWIVDLAGRPMLRGGPATSPLSLDLSTLAPGRYQFRTAEGLSATLSVMH